MTVKTKLAPAFGLVVTALVTVYVVWGSTYLAIKYVVEVAGEVGVLDPLALGGQQLDQLGATVGLVRSEDLAQVGAEATRSSHVHSFVSSALRGLRLPALELTAAAPTGRGVGRRGRPAVVAV